MQTFNKYVSHPFFFKQNILGFPSVSSVTTAVSTSLGLGSSKLCNYSSELLFFFKAQKVWRQMVTMTLKPFTICNFKTWQCFFFIFWLSGFSPENQDGFML